MNAKVRAARRRHARFCPLAYAAHIMPRGSIGSPPERGGGVYMITRSGLDTCRHRTPAWVLNKARVCSVLEPWDPIVGGPYPIRGGSDPIPGVWLAHVEILDQSWRSGLYIQGPGTLPWGSGLTVEALGSITFSRHVAAPDPPMWWGQALLWTHSSRPRLGRVMAWSHTQHPYHATKR
jgi:hypothetical protein